MKSEIILNGKTYRSNAFDFSCSSSPVLPNVSNWNPPMQKENRYLVEDFEITFQLPLDEDLLSEIVELHNKGENIELTYVEGKYRKIITEVAILGQNHNISSYIGNICIKFKGISK